MARPIPKNEITSKDIARFEKKYTQDVVTGCWLWQATKTPDGYGMFFFKGSQFLAHRFSFTYFRTEVPTDMELDHLCRNRACVNPSPDHLEIVTGKENILRGYAPSAIGARKTHCPQGHPYDAENTHKYTDKNGTTGRYCKACRRLNSQAYRTRRAS